MMANAATRLDEQLTDLAAAAEFATPGLRLAWTADEPIATDLPRLALVDSATIICETHDRDELGRPTGQTTVIFTMRRSNRNHELEPFYSYCDLSLFATGTEAGESALAVCELFWWADSSDPAIVHRFDVSVEWPLGRRLDPNRELREVTFAAADGTGEHTQLLIDEGLASSLELLESESVPRRQDGAYQEWTPDECRPHESDS